jgi:hypothetical protein
MGYCVAGKENMYIINIRRVQLDIPCYTIIKWGVVIYIVDNYMSVALSQCHIGLTSAATAHVS